MKNESESKSPPIHKIHVGSVVASIWRGISREGKTHYKTNVVRPYKDSENNYKKSDYYMETALLELSKAAELAHTWIVDRQAGDRVKRADNQTACTSNPSTEI